MKDIHLSNGDIDINASNGNVNMVDGDDELSQQVQLALNINWGELSWDRDMGIDFNSLLANGKRENVLNDIFSNYLRSRFQDTFQSLNITQYRIDAAERVLYFTAEINMQNADGSSSNIAVSNSIGGD